MADIYYGTGSLATLQSKIYLGEVPINKMYYSGSEVYSFPAAGPQPILTDLELWLDSDDSTSYPGTGTTWYDISPSGSVKDFTLVNSPTYTSGTGGYFSFNGTSQYASWNPGGGDYGMWDYTGTPNLTFEFSIYTNAFSSDQCFFSQWGISSTTDQMYSFFSSPTSGNTILSLTRQGTELNYVGAGMSAATWYHIFLEFEYDSGTGDYTIGAYRNNSFISSTTWANFSYWQTSDSDTNIGRRNQTGSNLYWGGRMGTIRFYPRLLDAAEKTNNYDIENAKYNF